VLRLTRTTEFFFFCRRTAFRSLVDVIDAVPPTVPNALYGARSGAKRYYQRLKAQCVSQGRHTQTPL